MDSHEARSHDVSDTLSASSSARLSGTASMLSAGSSAGASMESNSSAMVTSEVSEGAKSINAVNDGVGRHDGLRAVDFHSFIQDVQAQPMRPLNEADAQSAQTMNEVVSALQAEGWSQQEALQIASLTMDLAQQQSMEQSSNESAAASLTSVPSGFGHEHRDEIPDFSQGREPNGLSEGDKQNEQDADMDML